MADHIDRLRIDGMSGDVSEHRPGELKYIIKKLPWRSPKLTRFLRDLDILHLSKRFSKRGKPTQGALPHVRVAKERQIDHEAEPVPALPRNFYSPSWLARQDNEYIAGLSMQEEITLEIPAAVQKYDSSSLLGSPTNLHDVGRSIASYLKDIYRRVLDVVYRVIKLQL